MIKIGRSESLRITFMIGNGFDIGLGMKTRYSDYIPIYCLESKDETGILKDFTEELGANIDKWSCFERQLGRYTSEFTSENKMDMIKQVSHFLMKFMKYLQREEEKISWNSDFFKEALLDFYSSLRPVSYDCIHNVIMKEEKIVYNFLNFNYTNTVEEAVKTIPDKFIGTRTIGNTEYKILIGDVVHIHSSIGEFPIMGLNSEGQIENVELRQDKRFIERLVKPYMNARGKYRNANVAADLLSYSNIICIYGMSLGETDGIWWTKVIDKLFGDSSVQLIIFIHLEESIEGNTYLWMDLEDEVLDILQKYAGNRNLDSARNRIHISPKDIFKNLNE